jgi:hypothetical protein
MAATSDLRSESGAAGAFIYGSSLFHAPQDCRDIDVVVFTLGRQRLSHVALRYPGLPRISVTLVDTRTLHLDLFKLSSAGFLLNKLINPIVPIIGITRIALWQIRAMTTILALCGQSPKDLVRWKEEQFPGWRSTHCTLCLPTAAQSLPIRRRVDELRRSPELRGHWDVYRELPLIRPSECDASKIHPWQ